MPTEELLEDNDSLVFMQENDVIERAIEELISNPSKYLESCGGK